MKRLFLVPVFVLISYSWAFAWVPGTPFINVGTLSSAVTGTIANNNANSGALLDEAASGTNPTVVPDKTDLDTGLGTPAADQVSLTAGGVPVIVATENGYVEIQAMPPDSTHGGYVQRVFYATSGVLAGATDTIDIGVPSGWLIEQCQLHVKVIVVDDGGDDTWSSELNDGATEEAISTASAAAKNTNVNHFAHADNGYGGTLTDAVTNILLTPNGGNFTAGEIEAHCIAKYFDTWDND